MFRKSSDVDFLKTGKVVIDADGVDVDLSLPLRLDTTVGTRIFAGNTMIHGGTGYRSITPEIGWDPSVFAARMVVSRDGSFVELEARIVPSADLIGKPRGDQVPILSVPAGFRPQPINGSSYPSGTAYSLTGGLAVGTLGTLLFRNQSSLELRMSTAATGTWIESDGILLHALWRTDDPWPTSLPGLPV